MTDQYYKVLVAEGYDYNQIKSFEEYAISAGNGIISHNKAYQMACDKGFSNGNGNADKKSFGDWMNTAKESGWIDQGVSIIGGLISNFRNNGPGYYVPPPPPPPKKDNTLIFVVGGFALVGIGITIYFLTKNK